MNCKLEFNSNEEIEFLTNFKRKFSYPKAKEESDTMSEQIETAYIHVPFCKSKCFYCDFNSYADEDELIEQYFDALIHEIQIVNSYYVKSDTRLVAPLTSVFIGGGTPSYVPSKYIVKVINELRSSFGFSKDIEITIECNPGTVDLGKFEDYKNCGINRISIGLQSASDKILGNIGRIHTYKEFEECIDYADITGFTNRNVDLMFGLPGQTMSDVESTLESVLKKGATHVSFYSLILEEGTPFYQNFYNHTELLPSEDLEREMYWRGVEILRKNGFLHYEISNLAKTGFECKQNIAYWTTFEYLGFGAGAHSYQQETRIENESGIKAYIDKIVGFHGCSNAPAAIDRIELSQKERELEFFMLGFRLLEGISGKQFKKMFKSTMNPYISRMAELVAKGYIINKNGYYMLTNKGIDFANQVFMEFV